MKSSICRRSCLIDVNEAPASDLPCKIENQISTWLSQEALVGGSGSAHWDGVRARLVLLVGVEVVEDDVEFLPRISGDNFVHEVEELDAAAALVV